MKKYILDVSFGNELVNYLQGRPYIEVYKFIGRLTSLPVVQEEPSVTDEKDSDNMS